MNSEIMAIQFILRLLISSFLIFFFSDLNATKYYLSESLGNDNWSGTLAYPNSARTDGPKKSLSAFNILINSSAHPGDSFFLKRNDRWSGTVGIMLSSAQGSPTNYIYIGDYDLGELPQIIKNEAGEVLLCRGFSTKSTSYIRIHNLHLSTSLPFTNAPIGVTVNESFYPMSPHHIILSGLKITNCRSGMILYKNNILVENCNFFNNGNQNIGHGIFASVNNLTIKNCVLDSNGCGSGFVHTMYISHCDSVLLEGNEILRADDGLKLRESSNLIVRKNIIHDNHIHTLHGGGDNNGGMKNVIIEGNYIYNSPQGIELKSESGTQVEFTENVLIKNNIVEGPLTISNTSPMKNIGVYNNLFYNKTTQNPLAFILSSNLSSIEIRNNIFYKTSTHTNQALIYFPSNNNVQACKLSNNLYFASSSINNILSVGNNNYRSLDLFRSAYANQEVNSMQGNPNFIDELSFHLSSQSSLCIDKGFNLPTLVDRDFDNATRPLNGDGIGSSEWDIGPYEYSTTSSIDQQSINEESFILPNPFLNKFKVQSKSKILSMYITDFLGQKIQHSRTDNIIESLDALQGTYFVTIFFENNKMSIHKLIKL